MRRTLYHNGPNANRTLRLRSFGRAPTPLANAFLVLTFDFSTIQVGTVKEIERDFIDHVRTRATEFAKRYEALADWSAAVEKPTAAGIVDALRSVVKNVGLPPLYVIIDEYDNFTNELVVSRRDGDYDAICGHDSAQARGAGRGDGGAGEALPRLAAAPPRLAVGDRHLRRRGLFPSGLQLVRDCLTEPGRDKRVPPVRPSREGRDLLRPCPNAMYPHPHPCGRAHGSPYGISTVTRKNR